jgi:glycosyltransferase involved in cell wall biosynthesis
MIFPSKRPTIGIPFNYDEGWIGGTYYIKNLISSLNLLPDPVKPDIWILSHGEDSFEFIRKATAYPRLNWLRPGLLDGNYGGVSRKIKLLSWIAPWFVKKKIHFDMIYPSPFDNTWQQTSCWIPDFQDKHLPEFFSPDELAMRELQHRSYFENFKHLVFSSNAARFDFETFYPEARVNEYVVHFAVFEAVPSLENYETVLAKYGLPERFFYCPNQFWIHKNHDVVIDAVALLKKRGIETTVVFSGKEHDHRAPDYTVRLKARVVDEGLGNNVRFLGFIPRDDQMVIFRKAVSIIQPSLFEGWSTVIEDAKSVSQYILASRIPANVEQADTNIEFFEPKDPSALAELMSAYVEHDPIRKTVDYQQHQLKFAQSFMSLVKSVMETTQAGKDN